MKAKNNLQSSKTYRYQRAFFIVIFLLSTCLILTPLFFKNFLLQVQTFGLAGIFLINFFSSATLFLPAPGILSVVVGGNIYNPFIVALLASLGSALGESVGFLFGYSSHKVINFEKHKLFYHLLSFTFKRYGVLMVFLFSLIPNPLFDGIGILAGLSGFSPRKFILVVFAGRLIRNIAISYLGHYL